MESTTWPESLPSNRIKAIHELTQGQDLTNNLWEMLQWPRKIECDPSYENDVVVQIVAMFENTLSILGSCTSNQHLHQIPTTDLSTSYSSDEQKSENLCKSVGTIIPTKLKKGCYKRRKNSWTSSQVTSTLVDDGHPWRKYGQKQIQKSKYQRSYYRCTYKIDQGCLAAKQVQKIQDKPPKYKTTYIGNHTCKNLQRAPQIIWDFPNPRDTSVLLNFESNEIIAKTHVNYSSSSRCLPFEPILEAEMSQEFDCKNMISSTVHSGSDNLDDMISSWAYSSMTTTHGYDMDHML